LKKLGRDERELILSLLEKEKFERKISDGKIEIPHKLLGRKI